MHKIINYLLQNKYVILILIVILIICICIFLFILILILIVAYCIFKINHFNKTGNFIEMKDYGENTKKCLEKYGDYKIKHLYLVKKPNRKSSIIMMLNYVTLFKYNELVKKIKYFHFEILLVVKCEKHTQILKLHKSPNIILSDDVLIKKENKIKKIPIRSTEISVNELLTSAKKNMSLKYFNWNLIDNNCQYFSEEIIHILKKYNKTYISDNLITKLINKNNYTIYDVYILNIVSCFFVFCGNNHFMNSISNLFM